MHERGEGLIELPKDGLKGMEVVRVRGFGGMREVRLKERGCI